MSGVLPTGGYPNWVDPSTGDHCYARTGSKPLGQSPPPKCMCGHAFHTGPCAGHTYVDEPGLGFCHCPDGELDGDR